MAEEKKISVVLVFEHAQGTFYVRMSETMEFTNLKGFSFTEKLDEETTKETYLAMAKIDTIEQYVLKTEEAFKHWCEQRKLAHAMRDDEFENGFADLTIYRG